MKRKCLFESASHVVGIQGAASFEGMRGGEPSLAISSRIAFVFHVTSVTSASVVISKVVSPVAVGLPVVASSTSTA